MERIDRLSLNLYILEEKEQNILTQIQTSFQCGDKRNFLKNINTAKKMLRRRELRVTRLFIREGQKIKINIFGKPIDLFEKEILALHKKLFDLLDNMTMNNEPVPLVVLETLIKNAIETENQIVNFVRGLIIELKKE